MLVLYKKIFLHLVASAAYIFINALWLGQVKCSESKPNKGPRLTDTIKKTPHLIPFIIIFFAVSLLYQEVVFLIFFSQFCLYDMIYI